MRAQLRPAQTGVQTLIGRTVPVISRIDERGGKVFVEGELWNAVSESVLEAGGTAEIVAVNGLTVTVKSVKT